MTVVERAEDAYIILIEDDPNSYLVVEELVKHAGFKHFYHRSNGTKLVPLLEALPQVDLILLDIGLPGEDGFAVLKRLRAKDAGFDSFISKPIRPDKICDQIRSMLNGHAFWW